MLQMQINKLLLRLEMGYVNCLINHKYLINKTMVYIYAMLFSGFHGILLKAWQW